MYTSRDIHSLLLLAISPLHFFCPATQRIAWVVITLCAIRLPFLCTLALLHLRRAGLTLLLLLPLLLLRLTLLGLQCALLLLLLLT